MLLPAVQPLDQEAGHILSLEPHPVHCGPDFTRREGRRVGGHQSGDSAVFVVRASLLEWTCCIDDMLWLKCWPVVGSGVGWRCHRARRTRITVTRGQQCQHHGRLFLGHLLFPRQGASGWLHISGASRLLR